MSAVISVTSLSRIHREGDPKDLERGYESVGVVKISDQNF